MVGGTGEGRWWGEQGKGGGGGTGRGKGRQGRGERGDRKEWEEGKGEGSSDQTFKYFHHLPLKISTSFPLYHFRQTKFDRYYIMY